MERAAAVEALVLRVVGGADPAQRLQALTALRRELDMIESEIAADAVRGGMSWREIGSAIGVSKQAAHRRHSQSVALQKPEGVSERRSRRGVGVSAYARRAVRLARLEAARAGHQEIGTEHLLLGILQCGDAETSAVLGRFEVSASAVSDALEPTTQMPLEAARRAYSAGEESGATAVVSPLTRRVMERALTRAAAQGTGQLSAIELLGSALSHDDGGAARTLRTLGVDPAQVRAEIERVHAGALEGS